MERRMCLYAVLSFPHGLGFDQHQSVLKKVERLSFAGRQR
jgi:hypothetical protein